MRAKFSPPVSIYLASWQHTAHVRQILQIPAGILARQSEHWHPEVPHHLGTGDKSKNSFACSARAQQETVNDNSRLRHLRRDWIEGVKAAPVTRESFFLHQDVRILQTAWSCWLNKIRAEWFYPLLTHLNRRKAVAGPLLHPHNLPPPFNHHCPINPHHPTSDTHTNKQKQKNPSYWQVEMREAQGSCRGSASKVIVSSGPHGFASGCLGSSQVQSRWEEVSDAKPRKSISWVCGVDWVGVGERVVRGLGVRLFTTLPRFKGWFVWSCSHPLTLQPPPAYEQPLSL